MNFSKKVIVVEAPKHRNIVHLHAAMKSGAGGHRDLKKEANKKASRKFDYRKGNYD